MLIDDFNLANSIAAALVSTAIAIQNESTATANHAARSAYALQVLANPLGFARIMGIGFTADGATVVTSTDAQLKTQCSAIWNAYCVSS